VIRTIRALLRAAAALALVLGPSLEAPRAQPVDESGWHRIDYSELVDMRQLSHSGESVEILLRKLEGRPFPPAGERPADRLAHLLLDPLLEPYAFVLPDVADALAPAADPPLVEVGSLWHPGEAQPAWAELLRARRYVVESDGGGRLRAFVPWEADAPLRPDGLPAGSSVEAARAAWEAARSVLRHVLAAERRRLGGDAATLELAVHAYRHFPARLEFQLGVGAHRPAVEDLAVPGSRTPLDLAGLAAFLERGWHLEGARLEPAGGLRLLESRSDTPRTEPEAAAAPAAEPAPTPKRGKGKKKQRPSKVEPPSVAPAPSPRSAQPGFLGAPLELSDFAVAHRAVFHGGVTEPYMSLDRGNSPQTTLVTYGGRLRDTRIGWVSLLCDMRFKTFYFGLGMLEGEDLRARMRERVPGLLTHLERFARDTRSGGVLSEQIRFWFYPDDVDLTVSPQGDVLVLRRVRMTATSERVQEELLPGGRVRPDPPWTQATIADINRNYDALAELFPELADLDRAVRLLSFFTWLRQARQDGLSIPDLDVLLDLELPSTPTPRLLPQLLSFNALPPVGGTGVVEALDRVPIAEALERLNPSTGRPLPARERYARALGALDARVPDQRAMLQELRGYDASALSDSVLDLLAYRAERLVMHRTVLRTLPPADGQRLAARERAGESLRVFSVGIGGIDLGMQQALDRARGTSRKLGWGASSRPAPATGPARAAVAATRPVPRSAPASIPATSRALEWPAGLRRSRMPAHPNGRPGFTLSREADAAGAGRRVLAVYGTDGPEARTRSVILDGQGRARAFDRYEDGRRIAYTLERQGSDVRTRAEAPRDYRGFRARASGAAVDAAAAPARGAAALPPGLVALTVGSLVESDDGERLAVPAVELIVEKQVDDSLRELKTEHPIPALRRLVLGRETARGNTDLLGGLFPLPEWLGPVSTVMLLMEDRCTWPPWASDAREIAGERDPIRLADSLQRWWQGVADPAARIGAVVGTHPARSPARWDGAPRPKRAILLAPRDGFPPPYEGLRDEIVSGWRGGPVVESLDAIGKADAELVVLVSAEGSGPFAARLRSAASAASLRGKLLAGWSLTGPIRDDLPARLLADGVIAGLGVAEGSIVGLRGAAARLASWSRAIAEGTEGNPRVERTGGPFIWFF
jgi:hypothetical protein